VTIRPTEAIPFSILAKVLPSRPVRATIWSWYRRGLKCRRTGETVKLEAVRTPCGMGSTLEACDEFLIKLGR